MVDELTIAFLASLVFSCVIYFPLKLQGSWVLFWLTYYCTLCTGIGAAPKPQILGSSEGIIAFFSVLCCLHKISLMNLGLNYPPLTQSCTTVLFDTTALDAASVLAYLVAALSPSMEVANAALPTCAVILLFFTGFLLRWNSIPVWWKWCKFHYPLFLKHDACLKEVNSLLGQQEACGGNCLINHSSYLKSNISYSVTIYCNIRSILKNPCIGQWYHR